MTPVNKTLSYYQGDAFALLVYPKNSAGGTINLQDADCFFNIANIRGPDSDPNSRIITSAEPRTEDGEWWIEASFTGDNGRLIDNGFVYDIGYIKDSNTVTVVTGSFNVVLDVVGYDS